MDELRFVELQLSAVTTDMYLYLGWGFEEKAAMKAVAQKAHADLEELNARLLATNPPADAAELKDTLLEMIGRLQRIYQGIEAKRADVIKEEFAPFNVLHEQYIQLFNAASDEFEVKGRMAQPGEALDEELRWIEHPEDQESYRNAVALMEAGKTAEAYNTLKGLEQAVGAPSAGHLIQLRTSDALRMMDPEEAVGNGFDDALDASEYALDLLTSIVESGQYSPVLHEAFYKWRTTAQELHHGMSNESEIPNKAYNEARWRVIQTIKQYLDGHPRDAWAAAQLDRLWGLPNIQRGGPFGNDNLIHWAVLYRVSEGEDQNEE